MVCASWRSDIQLIGMNKAWSLETNEMRNKSTGRQKKKKDNVPLNLLLSHNLIVLPQLLQPILPYLGTWFDSLIRKVPLEGVLPITEHAGIRGHSIPLSTFTVPHRFRPESSNSTRMALEWHWNPQEWLDSTGMALEWLNSGEMGPE